MRKTKKVCKSGVWTSTMIINWTWRCNISAVSSNRLLTTHSCFCALWFGAFEILMLRYRGQKSMIVSHRLWLMVLPIGLPPCYCTQGPSLDVRLHGYPLCHSLKATDQAAALRVRPGRPYGRLLQCCSGVMLLLVERCSRSQPHYADDVIMN